MTPFAASAAARARASAAIFLAVAEIPHDVAARVEERDRDDESYDERRHPTSLPFT